MPGKFFPILILIITMNACAPNPRPTPTLYYTSYTIPAYTNTRVTLTNTPPMPTSTYAGLTNLLVVPTNEPPYPTNTPHVSDEIYPTPTFSFTFTPLPPLAPGENVFLASIHMMDETSGWAIEAGGWDFPNGGHILHTSDGAATWDDATPPQGSYTDDGFFALDANTAWASPFGINNRCIKDGWYTYCDQSQANIWATHDGGRTWVPSQPICSASGCDPSGDSNSDWILPRSIRFIDDANGWFLVSINYYMNQDRYKIYRTGDGGITWEFVTSSWSGDILTGGATGVEPLDRNHVLFTTNELGGAVDVHNELRYFTSENGAKNWEPVKATLPSNPIADPIWDELRCGIETIDSLPPLVVDLDEICSVRKNGEEISHNIHFHSRDGGKSWLYWPQSGDVEFIDADTGWQLTANQDSTFDLEQTHDGGLTWSRVSTVEWEGQLSFVNEGTGWALAKQGDFVSVVITTDGGRTWDVKTRVEITPTPTSSPDP